MIAKSNNTDEAGEVLESDDAADARPDETADASDSTDPADLPASPTIEVNLPAPVRSAPEDERAIAIDDVSVNPGRIAGQESAQPPSRS